MTFCVFTASAFWSFRKVWTCLSQKVTGYPDVYGGRERCLPFSPFKQVFWCFNKETWTFSCNKKRRFRIFPNHTQEVSAFCRHIYYHLHISCSHTQGDDLDMPLTPEEISCLGIPKEEPACSKTILVPSRFLMFLSWVVRFSLHTADICGAALGSPALPCKLLGAILELRTPFSYKAHWRQERPSTEVFKYLEKSRPAPAGFLFITARGLLNTLMWIISFVTEEQKDKPGKH